MKKSEIVRGALGNVRQVAGGGRVCYCTPSRRMVLSVEQMAYNNLEGATRAEMEHKVAEIESTLAEKLREATGRGGQNESLRDFDTEDTDAAYALTNRIVEEAFEKAAAMYEEQGS